MGKINNVIEFTKKTFFLLKYLIKKMLTLIPGLLSYGVREINKRLRFSITFKTTFLYTLILSKLLIGVSIISLCFYGFLLIHESIISLKKNGAVLQNFVLESSEIPREKIKKYAEIEGIIVMLFDDQDTMIYSSASNARVNLSARTQLTESVYIDQHGYMHVLIPAKADHIYRMHIAKSLAKEIFYLAMLVASLGMLFLIAVLWTIFRGSRASRRMLKPIYTMTQTARSISVGALYTRLDVGDSYDELKDLAETFNEMLDRIQRSYEQQQRFVSDASHELRTPIAVIQGYANLLQRWGKTDKEVLEESISAIKNEAENMQNLLEKLLFLARSDRQKQQIAMVPFALHELIDEVLKETILIDPTHDINSNINEAVTLYGDRGLLKQTLRICLDNSIKYTPSGGSITLNSTIRNNKAMLFVQDTGVGIPEEDLPYVFNRFYRCDKSRARASGGTGLGLSIAKWIVEAHRGAIWAESTQGQGTKIVISLPLN